MWGSAIGCIVTLLLGMLAAPLVTEGQTPTRVPRIGYLGISSPALEPHYVEAFRQQLRDLGYVEGQHIAIEYRWAEGQDARLPALAAELVSTKVDVIVTTGTTGTFAAKHATTTIPIVMASSGDPVRSGLVTNLARPDGNVTGFTVLGPELEGKRLELLQQAVPRLSRVGVLWNPANPAIVFYYQAIQMAGRVLHVTLDPVVEVRRVEELENAFATIASAHPDALVVLADRFLLAHRRRIVEFAAARRLPGMYPYREYVDAGGLMSYAPSNIALFCGAATYVDKILKGAKPGELPVQEPRLCQCRTIRPPGNRARGVLTTHRSTLMSTISVHLPDSLQHQLHALAERDGISIDQFIATAVAEKMAALLTEAYLEERAKRGSRAKYEAALAQVPDVEPELYDRLPQP